ncbi:MAG: phage tail protein [Nitrospirae bacterium]|nr:phage tail protein [Magnetococcales bacterium]HAT50967.1 phage tail protein [Alphaproteobacteria bacterium]
MAEPYIGEIRPFGYNFAPYGWAYCTGSTMEISQNQVLFAIIGNRFGGDGRQVFKLPDLQGRVPMGSGTGPGLTPRSIASTVGEEVVTIAFPFMPQHNHSVVIEAAGGKSGPVTGAVPTSQFLAAATFVAAGPPTLELLYSKTVPNGNALASNALSEVGGQENSGIPASHENRQPFLVINFCIALDGVFPYRPQ